MNESICNELDFFFFWVLYKNFYQALDGDIFYHQRAVLSLLLAFSSLWKRTLSLFILWYCRMDRSLWRILRNNHRYWFLWTLLNATIRWFASSELDWFILLIRWKSKWLRINFSQSTIQPMRGKNRMLPIKIWNITRSSKWGTNYAFCTHMQAKEPWNDGNGIHFIRRELACSNASPNCEND